MEIKLGGIYRIKIPGGPARALAVKFNASGTVTALAAGPRGGGVAVAAELDAFPDEVFTLRRDAFAELEGTASPQALQAALRALTVHSALACLGAAGRAKKSSIPASGKTLDGEELAAMVEASLDMWLTAGRFHDEFEKQLAALTGAKSALAVNSGSSANLLAVAALASHKLGKRRLALGDEVIVVAAAFPTTIAPLVQHGLVPVFADIDTSSCNIKPGQLERCLSPRTKAVFLAHTLGNPFDARAVAAFCKKHSLWLIEDNCDALGSTLGGKLTGTFGHLATLSFYPAHHITTGEGGALLVNDPELADIALSLRDWGRDCKCPTGKDGVCGARFTRQLGTLPYGYDHKYTYSHLGYNLKMTDWQAAIGLAQLKKLPSFTARRKENFAMLNSALSRHAGLFELPQALPDASPAWFGYPLTVRPAASFSRADLTAFLEGRGIGTRTLFGGNMLRQPALTDDAVKLRILESGPLLSSELGPEHYALLPGTEAAMSGTFWIGLWPGLGKEELDTVAAAFGEFLDKKSRAKL